MKNAFLNNGKEGKNNWWRHLIIIILSMPSTSVGVISGITLFNIIKANFPIENDLYSFLISTLFIFGFSTLFFFLDTKFLHQRKTLSFINTIISNDISGKTISWFKRFR